MLNSAIVAKDIRRITNNALVEFLSHSTRNLYLTLFCGQDLVTRKVIDLRRESTTILLNRMKMSPNDFIYSHRINKFLFIEGCNELY